jgi:hypothetical protein
MDKTEKVAELKDKWDTQAKAKDRNATEVAQRKEKLRDINSDRYSNNGERRKYNFSTRANSINDGTRPKISDRTRNTTRNNSRRQR